MVWKIPERVEKNENLTADPFVIREWEKNPDQTPYLLDFGEKGGAKLSETLLF